MAFQHVRFFKTRKEFEWAIFSTVHRNNYIFISEKPLWFKYQEGLIKELSPENVNSSQGGSLLLKQSKTKTMPLSKGVSIQKVTTKTKWHEINSTTHGVRIDQELIFSNLKKSDLKKYKIKFHPSALSKLEHVKADTQLEFIEKFLSTVAPGDYVMVFSMPDAKEPTHLHYPVQGWCTGVDVKNLSLKFIHPPRMEEQEFKFNDWKTDDVFRITAAGFYRKLVFHAPEES